MKLAMKKIQIEQSNNNVTSRKKKKEIFFTKAQGNYKNL